MVEVKKKFQRGDLYVILQGRDKQQKVFCILDTIARRAHLANGIPESEIVLES